MNLPDIPLDHIYQVRAVADTDRFAIMYRTVELHSEDYPVPVDQLLRECGEEPDRVLDVISRLAYEGLVERVACPDGARGHHIRPTEEGKNLMENLTPYHRTEAGREEDVEEE